MHAHDFLSPRWMRISLCLFLLRHSHVFQLTYDAITQNHNRTSQIIPIKQHEVQLTSLKSITSRLYIRLHNGLISTDFHRQHVHAACGKTRAMRHPISCYLFNKKMSGLITSHRHLLTTSLPSSDICIFLTHLRLSCKNHNVLRNPLYRCAKRCQYK